jgi:hypothetical protein
MLISMLKKRKKVVLGQNIPSFFLFLRPFSKKGRTCPQAGSGLPARIHIKRLALVNSMYRR